MKPLKIKFPIGSTVVGEILSDYSNARSRLSQDILQATLPGGVTIDVGWMPRFNPDGRFVITVFRDDPDSPLIAKIEEKSPFETANLVQQLIVEYSQPAEPTWYRLVSATNTLSSSSRRPAKARPDFVAC